MGRTKRCLAMSDGNGNHHSSKKPSISTKHEDVHEHKSLGGALASPVHRDDDMGLPTEAEVLEEVVPVVPPVASAASSAVSIMNKSKWFHVHFRVT